MATRNIIPTEEIFEEHFFENVHPNLFLPPVLSQDDYVGGRGQCMAIASVDTIRAKHNLASVQTKSPFRPLASVQQMVDAMTPKPLNYKEDIFAYAQDPGLTSETDYALAPVIEGQRVRNIETIPKQRILGFRSYTSMTNLLGNHDKLAIKDLGNRFGPLAAEVLVTKELLNYKVDGILTGKNYSFHPNSNKIQSHGVMLLGFGVTKGHISYWIARNNWGKTYGYDGIFRIDSELVTKVYSPFVSDAELGN